MENNRNKKLIRDTLYFFFSGFGSKILLFLLVPLYTKVLSPEEYGIADLIITITTLLMPLLTGCIADAVLRFGIENEKNKNSLIGLSITIGILSTSLLVISSPIVSLINQEFYLFYGYLILYFLTSYFLNIFTNLCNSSGNTKLVSIAGVIYTLFFLFFNIFFLIVLKLGIRGYLLSLILSEAINSSIIIVKMKYWRLFGNLRFQMEDAKKFFNYSLPLVPTTIFWWINSSADRIMLTYFIGFQANGLYGVAHKIPTILTAGTSFFSKAWQLSAMTSIDDSDYSSFFYRIFRLSVVIYSDICIALVLLTKPMAYLLFSGEFHDAWKYVPVLILGALFSSLSGCLNAAFTASKTTTKLFKSTGAGVIVNILLNIPLILLIGVQGAAIATTASLLVVLLIRLFMVKKILNRSLVGLKDILGLVFIIALSSIIVLDLNLLWGGAIVVLYYCCYHMENKEIIRHVQSSVNFTLSKISNKM